MGSYSSPTYIPERRRKPRVVCHAPALILGHDENGKKVEEEGIVVNLSRCGMFLLLHREFPVGTFLMIRVSIPTGFLKLGTSKFVVQGTVVRGENRNESTYGIAVTFEDYRFI